MRLLTKCLAVAIFAVVSVHGEETATATATDTAAAAVPKPAGQQGAAVAAAPKQDAAAATKQAESKPSVKWVRGQREDGALRLGDEVCIGVIGFEALRAQAAAVPKPITLWLNGLDSKLERNGEGGEDICSNADPKKQADFPGVHILSFRVERTTDNAKLWRNLLRNPFGERTRPLTLSVGVSEDKPIPLAPDSSNTLTLEKRFWAPKGVVGMMLIILVIALLFRYASDMLRSGPDVDNQKQAYSLGRSQMAWWFILIIASYITIWLITGDGDTITESLLVLMGISAVTAMGSIAIDANAPARADDMRKELEQEKASLASSQNMMEAAAGGAPPTPQEQAATSAIDLRMTEIDQTVANVTKPAITTGSWLRDVLTDNNGSVALHRFQILAWTVVLGFIFLASVVRDLSMPEFNTTLLTLMGISAGTYLGFKLPTNGG